MIGMGIEVGTVPVGAPWMNGLSEPARGGRRGNVTLDGEHGDSSSSSVHGKGLSHL